MRIGKREYPACEKSGTIKRTDTYESGQLSDDQEINRNRLKGIIMDSVPQSSPERNYVPTIEVKAAADRLGALRAAERDMVRVSRFESGDIFNAIRFDSGPRADYLMERFGEEEYKFFRHCGWVAHRWPKKDRIPGKPWRYFRDNIPGAVPRVPTIPTFHITDARPEDGSPCLVGTNGRGRSVRITGTIEELRRAMAILEETFRR